MAPISTTGATRSSSTTAAAFSPASRCATSSTRPAGFERPSLRAGRKIDPTPGIGRLITNNIREINCLGTRRSARAGRLLREADRPLREGAGRYKLSMRHRRLCVGVCAMFAFSYIDNTTETRYKQSISTPGAFTDRIGEAATVTARSPRVAPIIGGETL